MTHWSKGDLFGIDIPGDTASLRAGGAHFLTKAFQASGALSSNNRIIQINEAKEFFGGGTGTKMLLAVEYASPECALPQQLFVKFSRNFNDPMRDRSRHMMVSEVKFAALSRTPGFPITVPACVFADVNTESGSGLIITERLRFGSDGIAPLYQKCMDYQVPDPLDHYRTILKSLAQLSGAYKAGKLANDFDKQFPCDVAAIIAADPLRYSGEKLERRINRIVQFIASYPQLFPENLISSEFHQQLLADVPVVVEHEQAIKQFLYRNPDMTSLCHWNANIDNGWYWRDANGELQCGLMDWGRVGQMSVAQEIYGSISGAETWVWNQHLDELIDIFIEQYAASGGPYLNHEELKLHVILVTITMGLAYLMDAPAIIERQIDQLAATTAYQDDCFQKNEDARIQLHMLTMFLNQWQTQNPLSLIRQLEI